jgi:hypothetical protein
MVRKVFTAVGFFAASIQIALITLVIFLSCSGRSAASEPTNPANEACIIVGNNMLMACSRGYFGTGGQEGTKEFDFANEACSSAAQLAYGGCARGIMERYDGATGKGLCADTATYVLDSISGGCMQALKSGKVTKQTNKFFQSCVGTWAPKGSTDFQAYCEEALKHKHDVEL